MPAAQVKAVVLVMRAANPLVYLVHERGFPPDQWVAMRAAQVKAVVLATRAAAQ